MATGGSTYYLTYDQIGSLRVVADASGNVIKRIDYDSFGNIIVDTNPSLMVPFRFAGGLHDRDTGLVRFGYRDYDPDTGRWTAKDPIFFDGGDTDLYGYCLNNSINLVDPDGRFVATLTLLGYVYGPAIVTGVVAAVYQLAPYSPFIWDFTQGFIFPGPPPPTPCGYSGFAVREFFDEIWKEYTN
jgi:RHS repeat-associated protein